MKIGLSFDIEDYHNETMRLFMGKERSPSSGLNVQCGYLLDRLEEMGIRATFFLLGSLAQNRIDLVKRIHRAGHEVEVHGFEHIRLEKLTPTEFHYDISRTVDTIQMAISLCANVSETLPPL